MRKHLGISFLLIACSMLVQAQNINANSGLDERYTPPANSVLGSEGGEPDGRGGPVDYIKNSVKYNPMFLTRSINALFYERSIAETVTIQGGIGFSYKMDLIQAITADALDILENSSSSLSLSTIMLNSKFRSGGTNVLLSFSFKFYSGGYYWDSYAFEGGYMEIGTRYNTNELVLDKDKFDSYDRIANDQAVLIETVNFYLTYGYQFYTSGKLKTTHDFSFGFGLKKVTYDSFQSSQGYDLVTSNSYSLHEKTGEREFMLVPTIFFGYALGIGF